MLSREIPTAQKLDQTFRRGLKIIGGVGITYLLIQGTDKVASQSIDSTSQLLSRDTSTLVLANNPHQPPEGIILSGNQGEAAQTSENVQFPNYPTVQLDYEFPENYAEIDARTLSDTLEILFPEYADLKSQYEAILQHLVIYGDSSLGEEYSSIPYPDLAIEIYASNVDSVARFSFLVRDTQTQAAWFIDPRVPNQVIGLPQTAELGKFEVGYVNDNGVVRHVGVFTDENRQVTGFLAVDEGQVLFVPADETNIPNIQLAAASEVKQITPALKQHIFVVDSPGGINVRPGPSTDDESIDHLAAGIYRFTPLGQEQTTDGAAWTAVWGEFNDTARLGWIRSDLISDRGEVATGAENIWQASQVIDGRAGRGRAIVAEGVVNDEFDTGPTLYGRLAEVFQGGILEQDDDYWYLRVEVNGAETVILLGENEWSTGIGKFPLDNNHNVFIPNEDAGKIFSVEEIIPYLQQNIGMPIRYELYRHLQAQIDMNNQSSACDEQCHRRVDLMVELNIVEFINTVMRSTPRNGSYYSGELPPVLYSGFLYIPGFYTPDD